MPRFRLILAVLCVCSSIICGLSAKPKQSPQVDKCHQAYNTCMNGCKMYEHGSSSFSLNAYSHCTQKCLNTYNDCYMKATSATPPPTTNRTPQVTASAAPTASPGSSPKKVKDQNSRH